MLWTYIKLIGVVTQAGDEHCLRTVNVLFSVSREALSCEDNLFHRVHNLRELAVLPKLFSEQVDRVEFFVQRWQEVQLSESREVSSDVCF